MCDGVCVVKGLSFCLHRALFIMATQDKTGVFEEGKKSVTVSYDATDNILKWDNQTGPKENNNIKVAVKDIYAVQTGDNTLTVHYVGKKVPGYWSRASLTFTADDTQCGDWRTYIQRAISDTDQERPTRLLVFINPFGGKGTAEKDYNRIAKPIFSLAGVTDDVIVTENKDSPDKVLADYDLTTIDGIIVVGGDGTFTTVAAALMRRIMKDAGKDPDDSKQDLVHSHIRLGMFPGGTGCSVVKVFTGIEYVQAQGKVDFATPVLQTILGYTMPGKLMTIHNNNKLIGCPSVLFGYGLVANAMKRAEELRPMGTTRYLVGMIGQVKSFHQPHKLTLSYSTRKEGDNASEDTWLTQTGNYKMLIGYGLGLTDGKTVYNLDKMSITTMDETGSRGNFLKYMYHAAITSENIGKAACFEKVHTVAAKIELPDVPEGANVRHAFLFDGEIFDAQPGVVSIRLHQNVFMAYGTGRTQSS